MAQFIVPEDGLPWTDFDGTDEKKATVMVNPKIMVASNMVAAITPMFVEGASPVGVMPGMDNMPFEFVAWSAMQYDVVMNGATFAIHKASIGANQEMMPTGDAVYITCGPFECAPGDMAPEISIANSAACSGWMPEFTLEVGMVDNDGTAGEPVTGTAGADRDADGMAAADGMDLGWVYSSTAAFGAEHDFGTYTPMGETGGSGGHAKGSDRALAMSAIASGTVIAVDRTATVNGTATHYQGCESFTAYGEAQTSGSILRPQGCFRLSTSENYLSEYQMTATAKGAGVTWGDSEVEWEEDPFKDYKCDSMSVMAADHVDVCSLFEDELTAALKSKKVVAQVTGTGNAQADTSARLSGLSIEFKDAKMRRFKSLYYLAGSGSSTKSYNLYSLTDPDGDGTDLDTALTTRTALGAGHLVDLLDDDGDPMYGDLGKVDIHAFGTTGGAAAGAFDRADNFPDGDDAGECSADDGGAKATTNSDKTAKTAGTLCDAEDVVIPVSITFGYIGSLESRKFKDHACAMEETFEITCDWDASGEMDASRSTQTGDAAIPGDDTGLTQANVARFLKCEVS